MCNIELDVLGRNPPAAYLVFVWPEKKKKIKITAQDGRDSLANPVIKLTQVGNIATSG